MASPGHSAVSFLGILYHITLSHLSQLWGGGGVLVLLH